MGIYGSRRFWTSDGNEGRNISVELGLTLGGWILEEYGVSELPRRLATGVYYTALTDMSSDGTYRIP